MSNVLPREKQIAILSALVEGSSIRSTERMVGVSRETVLSLLVRVGAGCERLLDEKVRGLASEHVEVDEIWGFIQKKQRHLRDDDDASHGDVWCYVALDPDTKLAISYRVAKRTAADTNAFVEDLASRLTRRVQISSDGLGLYVDAIERAFGTDVDYAQIVKSYEVEPAGSGRYSPPKVTETKRTIIVGNPDKKRICTSYVERQNLTMRTRIRRLTRLTNAFSKKIENHRAAMALHFAHYNFVATHGSLRITPAMAANIASEVWSVGDLLDRALGTAA